MRRIRKDQVKSVTAKLSLGGFALTAFIAGPAISADLKPRMYRAPVAAPVIDWTGFYVGLNAGGSIGVDAASQNAAFTSTALGTNGLLSSSNRYTPTGWLYGGQIGYNWQLSSFVLGVEADWQWMSERDSASNCTPPVTTVAFFGVGANGFGYCLSGEQKLTNLATVRGASLSATPCGTRRAVSRGAR